MLRDALTNLVDGAVARLVSEGKVPEAAREVAVEISDTKSPEHGDYACNFALTASKRAGMNPRQLGEMLREAVLADGQALLDAIDVAGPGFLNLRVRPAAIAAYVPQILALGDKLPNSEPPAVPRRLNVEFVSVNPNGPITIGSGRGAAFGDTLCRVLEAAGDQVDREYYINDGVNSEQMRLFAESVRSYVTGKPFPEKGYRGDYVRDVATGVVSEVDELYSVATFAALVILDHSGELTGDREDDLAKATELVRSFRNAVIVAMGLFSGGVRPEPNEILERVIQALSAETELVDSDFVNNEALAESIASSLTAVALSATGDDLPSYDDALEVVRYLADRTPMAKPNRTIENWVGTLMEKRKRLDIYASAKAYGDSLLAAFSTEDLADQPVSWFQSRAQAKMIERQRNDLALFGVRFDRWFSEQSLHDEGKVAYALDKLKAEGNAYFASASKADLAEEDAAAEASEDAQDGALWLASTQFGDDKDRVLVRADGRPAYIAADVAYLEDKLGTRGYDKSLLILGPDHHGYIGRMYAACRALGYEGERFKIIIFQLVRFLKDGKPAPMRKRDGNIYELRDLIDEIGNRAAPTEPKAEQQRIGADVARFFYLMRSQDTAMDFDIDLATKQSDDNPVFYAQYAHARICSVIEKAKGTLTITESPNTELLVHPREGTLIKKILDLPWEVKRCAADYGIHRLATYSVELARTFHHFYDACRVVQVEEPELSAARVALCEAARGALKCTFDLLGVSAPTRMERREALSE